MADSETKKLVKRRAYVKGLITQDIKKITSVEDEQLNNPLLEEFIHKTDANLVTVEESDASISEIAADAELESIIETGRDYNFEVQKTLAKL